MFKIDTSDTYKYPVTVEMLNEQGKFEKKNFTAIFHRLPRSEVESIMQSIHTGEMTDNAVAIRVLAGWEGIVDQDGDAIDFTDETRDMVLNIHPVQPTVVRAWGESINGKGKTKN